MTRLHPPAASLIQACRFTVTAGLMVLGSSFAQLPDPEAAPAPPAAGTVQVWLTTADASKKLTRQPDLAWSMHAAAAINVTVNETNRFQQIDGFGATILDSSLWDADPAVRGEIMRLLFSRSSGIGLSLIRIPMGLSGLTGPHRTYNDMPPGQTDPSLARFSIAGDELWKLPMMQQAKALNPELTLMGTPWSAPAWMKDSGSLGYGKLKPEYYGVYAQYFVKWLDSWRANGLGISAVTMQNEPHYEPYWYQGMRMEPADQIAFGLQLGPAFKQAGHSTRILCWDHNCDEISYPITVMDDPAARNWIHGAAFHAYAGSTSDIHQFTDAHPDKEVHFTEQTGSYPSRGFGGSLAWHLRNIFLVPSLNGARCNLVWQLARKMDDTLGGDRPFVRIAPDGKSYELHGEYYETGHFSKFIRKGARRIETNNTRDATTRIFNGPLLYAAYQNPDASKSLVVLNDSSNTQSFTLEDLGVSGRRVPYSMPAGAIATFHWRDSNGGSGLAATYFDNADLTGMREHRIDPQIDFTWAPETYISPDFTRPAESPVHSLGPVGFSARWEGQVVPPNSETHTFHATASDGVRLWVNNQLVIDQWVSRPVTETSGSIFLTANQPATVKMEYFSSASTGGGRAALAWSTPTVTKQIIPRERLYPPAVATVPPPPLGLTARAPGSSVQLAWAAAPTAASYTVRRATSQAGPFTVLAGGLTTTCYSDTSASAGTGYIYQVAAVNAHGEGATSAPASVTPRGSTLSSPWTQQDIGTVGTAGVGGNAGDNGETVVLGGAGSDIWNTSDSFRFAWLPLTGDGTIIARVASMEDTSAWAKAGLMIRESLANNSAYVNIVCTPGNGVSVQSRASTGASATSTTVSNLFAPRWLKLTRSGSSFTAFHSTDGVNWTQTAAPVTVAMGNNVHIGLAVCSGQTSALNLVRFDGISAPGLPLPRPPAPQKPEALPGNATVNLAWAATPYATSYEILRATAPGGPYTSIATVGTTSFQDATAQNDITYDYVIRAVNSTGAGSFSTEVSATPRSSYLPAGWVNRDIGTVGLDGSVSLTSGVYTIQAAGAGVWSMADGFNYSYRAATGDGSMTVRVDSLANVNPQATKSGLMFRSSATPNAAYAYLAVTPSGEVKFEYRSADGASAASQGSASGAAPRWLRLQRSSNIVRAFSSANGSTWSQLGADLTLNFAGDFLAGIAVTANNTTTRTTSVLSQLSITGFAGPLTPANLTATAGLDGVRLAWAPVAGASGYRVKRMAGGESTYSLIATVDETSYHDTSIANRTSYSYVITALSPEGESSPSNAASVTTNLAPLPSAWSDSDIGTVGLPGSADHGAGTFTVRGSGSSLAGSTDSFHACSIHLSGAVTFTARVANVGVASGSAKVGIMLRESTATDARFAYVGISPAGAMEFRYRTSAGGSVTVGATASAQSLPRYLRLTVTRSSKRSAFTAYHSADGDSWTTLGSSPQINNMPSAILGSLVVCSMNNGALHTAVFDQVAATGHSTAGVPTGLAATVTPTTIDLAWDAAANAANYRVKRSTSPGGPYFIIAQSTATAWQDITAADGTTYYYVISAVNSFSESANSSQVSAIRESRPPAAPGRWLADVSGQWGDTAKWSAATPAGGSITADFSAIDITADRYVTLTAPVSLPGMVFGDTNPASIGCWILQNGDSPSNTLTLAGSTPAIDVQAPGPAKAAVIQAEISGTNGLRKTGPGILQLSGNNSYTGGTTLNAGSLVAANPTALGAAGTVTFNAGSGLLLELATPDGKLTNPYTLDMGSNRFNTVRVNRGSPGSADYALGTLRLGASTMTFNRGTNITGTAVVRFATLDLSAGNNDRPVIVNGDATLHIGSAAILSNSNISKRLQLDGTSTANTIGPIANGSGTGILSLIKSGTGTWNLTGNNRYTGTTTVQAGELRSETATLPDSATVMLSTGGTLNLNFTGTDIIGSLVINSVPQRVGTWGGLASSASNRSALITGPGTITILPAAYVTWANGMGLSNSPDIRVPSADPDSDGLANSLEWVLGGHPLTPSHSVVPTLTPAIGGFVFSFLREPASMNDVPLAVEWSDDMQTWNRIPVGAVSSLPDEDGYRVTVTPAIGAPDRIDVSVPDGPARTFLRLSAAHP